MDDDILSQLQQATSEWEKTWIITSAFLKNLPIRLAEATLAATVPHWFDVKILATLLTTTSVEAGALYERIKAFPFCEPFGGDLGYALHDITRSGILFHLTTIQTDVFRTYSQLAYQYFCQFDDPQNKVESIYHLLAIDEVKGLEKFKEQMEIYRHENNFSAEKNLRRNARELENLGLFKKAFCMDTDTTVNDLKKRLERLFNRLLKGSVIPVVGAGISMAARIPGKPSFEPSVRYLRKQLLTQLENELMDIDLQAPEYQVVSSVSSLIPLPNRNVQDCRLKANQPPLAWLAELSALLWGHSTVCNVLQIEQFADLEPLAAHRYLAYLSREGLITEIISTNYDCCIEKAFHASFGPEPEINPDSFLAVVCNSDEYRNSRDKPIKLYKINGCAQVFREADIEAAAEQIIFTERQLQNFRNAWIKEMFRDRARRYNPLFCGFGSEEPQVRHTALSLIEEFKSNNAQSDPLDSDAVAALPNTLFLAARTVPSYTQLQILTAFVNAHIHREDGDDPGDIRSQMSSIILNPFSGQDAPELGANEQTLSADLFLQRIYQCIFHLLVWQQTIQGSVFDEWLRKYAETNRTLWRDYFLKEAKLPAVAKIAGDETQVGNSGIPPYRWGWGAWHRLLEPPADGQGPLPLWRWLWAIYHPDKADEPPEKDWYLPLCKAPLFIVTTLLLLSCLRVDPSDPNNPSELEKSLPAPRPVPNCGLEVNLASGGVVYLIHQKKASVLSGRVVTVPSAPKIRGWIVLPDSEPWSPLPPVRVREERGGAVKEISQEMIYAGELIRHASTPENILEALSLARAAHRPVRRAKTGPVE
jgi:hypothetical protein